MNVTKNTWVWVFPLLLFFVSCNKETEDYDPYFDWQSRNAAWYTQIADSARTAIRAARAQYGDSWDQYCDWRMYKSLQRSPSVQSGLTEDSICVHILRAGLGTVCPTFSDTVRVCFRGWLMPTPNAEGKTEELTFTQTYYGTYNPNTAYPQLSAVSSFADGFSTALQYMVEGDDWMIYLPQQLFYGSEKKDVIPAYSTVRFRVQLVGVYPAGTKIPEWK